MDLAIIISVGCLAFGAGVWFYRIKSQLNKIGKDLAPLIILHKNELIKYYLEKGVMPNPSMTPHKKYLIDRLEAGTMSYSESQELSKILKGEEAKAKKTGDTDALIAILGLIALVVVIASLLKK